MSESNSGSLAEKIRAEVDPSNFKADASAKAENSRYRNHSLDDADDNYAIRKAVKNEFIAHAKWMFRISLGLVVLLIAGLIALIVDYIWCIWPQFEKVETLLSHMFTHVLALVAGLLLKAVFGHKKEEY